MSISFNRNRTQVAFEQLIGVSNPGMLKNKKTDFKSYTLQPMDVINLAYYLNQDAVDFFFNGVLSFSEGIDSVFQRRFSWATVKLYYSIYYLIRASLAAQGVAVLQNSGMFRLKIKNSEKPFSKGGRKYNSTHEGTINHYRDLCSDTDLLLANHIGDSDVYEWMHDIRNIVNYRSSSFQEPQYLDIWKSFVPMLDNGTLPIFLDLLENDEYILCFQEEFAVIGIPIKRLKQTIEDMAIHSLLQNLASDKEVFVKNVIGYDDRSLTILRQIFQR